MPQLKILRCEIPPKPRAAKFYNINFKIYVVIRTACRILRFRHGGISRAVLVAVKFYVAKFSLQICLCEFYEVKFLEAEFAALNFIFQNLRQKFRPVAANSS